MGARGIRDGWFGLAMIVVAVHSATDRVSAQALGTFRWQLQPFCNVVTLTIARENGVYTLDGVDDGCGVGHMLQHFEAGDDIERAGLLLR